MPIVLQTLNVAYTRDDQSGLWSLTYIPGVVGESAAPPLVQPVERSEVEAKIGEIEQIVDKLNQRALCGQHYEDSRLEEAAWELARLVLPEKGFVGMLAEGCHPHLDTWQDLAYQIPWEVLEDRCFTGACGYRTRTEQRFCPNCGNPLKLAVQKLAIEHHLTHFVRGSGRVNEGDQFLFIQDPTGDLRLPKNDPEGICVRHLDALHALVQQRGFELNVCDGPNATASNVLAALSNPRVAGVYYFGHGYFPRGAREGCLLLADGPLSYTRLVGAKPAARFVFLNACSGAAAGRDWGLESRPRNVAAAFAQGRVDKVVIAPLWPIPSYHAAESALAFFERAADSQSLGEAMRQVRQISFEKFHKKEPHLAWMAYRYFGNPGHPLPPAQRERPPTVVANQAASVPLRVFANGACLASELFAFDLEPILFRAAKRRNQQGRALVTLTDLLAALIRKGALTREVFHRLCSDADLLYQNIQQQKEDGNAAPPRPSAATPEDAGAPRNRSADFREFMALYFPRDAAEFDPALRRLLEQADRAAQTRERRTEDRRITELDLLECLLAGPPNPAWNALASLGLPGADPFRHALGQVLESGDVDENGELTLKCLAPEGRDVVRQAHLAAQQRGVFPISHRLLLAAFLFDDHGVPAELCRRCGIDKDLLGGFMLAATALEAGVKRSSSLSFRLSREACERVVLPVIQAARRSAADPDSISIRELFLAFCETADPSVKAFLRTPFDDPELESAEADLDDVRQCAVNQSPLLQKLTLRARTILRTAHSRALQAGVFPISARLLLAAFLSQPKGLVAQAAVALQAPLPQIFEQLGGAGGRPAGQPPSFEAACARVVEPMLARARELAGPNGFVTELLLFRAFCELIDPAFKDSLRQILDLDRLQSEVQARLEARTRQRQSQPPAPRLPPGWMPENLDPTTRQILQQAALLCVEQGWNEIRSPHLFVAMIGEGHGPTGELLRQHGHKPSAMRVAALSLVPGRAPSPHPPPRVPLSETVQRVFEDARRRAVSAGRPCVSEKDLVDALLADPEGAIPKLLRPPDRASGPRETVVIGLPLPAATGAPETPPAKASVLASHGVDLTERARRGQSTRIVGRDHDIDLALQTLLRMENANPLLVGEAGVGKTAIVEGIAERIAHGRCPSRLRSMRVIELSAGSLVANTQLRGEFEQRIQQVLLEARKDVILFIDEIHTIVGAGAGEGGLDTANMLKAALARGELRLIGSTTPAECKRAIERDRALLRRFQRQIVSPPTREATIEILSARQQALEQHYNVRITEEAKTAAVDLSGRYILDKQWPAKARDVLEGACAEAVTIAESTGTTGAVEILAEHVARFVARQARIPVERVSTSDLSALATLPDRVGGRIIGQRDAIETVTSAIRRGRQGLSDRSKPWGVFLFVGPPGVGKTELAKVLAEEVYPGAEGLIRFDMGDFTESHSTARLVGAPPGYLGYDQGAPLVERLRAHPYSLLLFDEIEHAHENVLAVLLRLLSEGTLVDADGNPADARNAIVILTSNMLGGASGPQPIGFNVSADRVQPSQTELRASLAGRLPVQFIDRVDEVVHFKPLGREDLAGIASSELGELAAQVAALYRVQVDVAPEIAPWLAEKAATENAGARGLKRAVDREVGGPFSAFLGAKAPPPGGRIGVSLNSGVIAFSIG